MKNIKFITLCIIIFSFFHTYGGIEELKETIEGRFETLNKMGWAIGPEDEYSKEFIVFASSRNGWNLEVGAAYGLTAREAVLAGAKMIVNDLDAKHLDFFKKNIAHKYHQFIQLKPGDVLNLNLEPASIESILASRVLYQLQ
ncbi:methyltransferase domain-containing protein [Candidatus Tisiphia endosymbiont of Metellina segmentata]|uniref:methyltransferase domain-containing protein n=1 Tax=Candidatus Tisiphia endosymbiont of Metellina segmentata TaxID=3066274 RepID=UPI00313E5165